MSQSQSIREAIKCPDESTGHSLCLVLPFYSFPKTPFHSPAIPPFLSSFLSSPSTPISRTPLRLVLTRILSMAVNTVPFSDPFGSKEVKGGWVFLALLAAEASTTRE